MEDIMKVIACSAPHGSGGLGRHFSEIVEIARRDGTLARYFSSGVKVNDSSKGYVVRDHISPILFRHTPIRFSPGWRGHLSGDIFDRYVAARLKTPIQTYVGFGGQAKFSFQAARKFGATILELHAANSHVRNVQKQHRKALQRYPYEQSWLNEAQCRKTLCEYAMADRIFIASEYTRQSFLREGVPAEKLCRWHLHTDTRFVPREQPIYDGIFRVVYVGSLTVMKGIPILLEAFARLSIKKSELILVGGWASRGMKHYLKEWQTRDPRIKIAPGDPLPHLQSANAYVHPTFEDGWAYAPAEALACELPVIVTEDTGMKELITEGVNGYIVSTGSWEAILERLQYLHQYPSVLPMGREVSVTR